jgi:serine/threonine protein kinase
MIGKIISHYKISEELGRGGMGVVYKAQDTKLDRPVAIKFLPRQLATSIEETKRFEREAKAAAALNHPNIATVHAIEELEDDQRGKECFIVMEYIDGQELREKIKTSPLSTEEILKITYQIAEGLYAAHNKGIVHRDIKSSNIMITRDGQVKIMDFGLAKLAGQSMLTKSGTTLGTVAYMSPEQARGEPVDQRSDIWSLGVIIYEMITGQLPFKGEYDQAVIYSILNEEPEAVNTEIPPELSKIISKSLMKDVKQRYQDIHEVISELQGHAEPSKITFRPQYFKIRKYVYASVS